MGTLYIPVNVVNQAGRTLLLHCYYYGACHIGNKPEMGSPNLFNSQRKLMKEDFLIHNNSSLTIFFVPSKQVLLCLVHADIHYSGIMEPVFIDEVSWFTNITWKLILIYTDKMLVHNRSASQLAKGVTNWKEFKWAFFSREWTVELLDHLVQAEQFVEAWSPQSCCEVSTTAEIWSHWV